MMKQYLKELEQDPFDPDEFVERMVGRSMEESNTDDEINPELINDIFTQAIQDLGMLLERQEEKCARLEQEVKEEEKQYIEKIAEIMDQHTHCVNVFNALDERMSRCGGQAQDVGEKLGAARVPRSRAAAARHLLAQLAHFLSPGPVLTDLFNDPAKLNEAADVIQKLYTISQELPPEKFEVAKKKIEAKYDEIERNLIEEFVKAQNQGNMIRMKEIANIMTNFKGYSQCVDAFIETSQMNTLLGKDIFTAVLPLCTKNYTIISNVFPNPEQVMCKFVLNIFHLKLQKYIQTKLADKNDIEKYLKNLYDMYTGTQRVCDELIAAGLIQADTNSSTGALRRDALIKGALAAADDGYKELEIKRLKAVMSVALKSYYNEKQHVKKQIQGGSLQALLTKANINFANIENYGGETFLSESLVQKLLNEARNSFQRCKALCSNNDLSQTTSALLDVVIQHVLVEHVDYALDLGIQSIPIADSKSPPQIYFFEVVKVANNIINLFEKHFNEAVVPCLGSMSKQNECLERKSLNLDELAKKLDFGLERALSAIVSWVKLHLQTEQKKSDFKPEGDIDTIASPACSAVVAYLNTVLDNIHKALEGDNLNAVTLELALRLHRVIYEHLQNFQFNLAGAMIAICDVREYRSAVCGRGSRVAPSAAHAPYNALHALCNLLLVKPENLQQFCEEETLAKLGRPILLKFIELRTDYKSHKLANCLKGLS